MVGLVALVDAGRAVVEIPFRGRRQCGKILDHAQHGAAAFGEEGNEESFRTALRYIRAFMDKIVNAPPEKGFFERVLDFLREVGFFRPGNETTAGLAAAETAHA